MEKRQTEISSVSFSPHWVFLSSPVNPLFTFFFLRNKSVPLSLRGLFLFICVCFCQFFHLSVYLSICSAIRVLNYLRWCTLSVCVSVCTSEDSFRQLCSCLKAYDACSPLLSHPDLRASTYSILTHLRTYIPSDTSSSEEPSSVGGDSAVHWRSQDGDVLEQCRQRSRAQHGCYRRSSRGSKGDIQVHI